MKLYTITTTLLSNTNIRLISTQARNVSGKITKAIKNAKVNQSILESRAKASATATIKAKAAQAGSALKLPKEHIWWALWLLQNSIKSLQKGFEVWMINMNKYKMFRFMSFIIGYLLWPVQKVIQVLAYIKFIRMVMLIFAFLFGLLTNPDDLRGNITNLTGMFALNIDTIISICVEKLEMFTTYLKSYVVKNHLEDPAVYNKAFPTTDSFNLNSEEESSWPSKKVLIFVGITALTCIGLLTWVYFYGGGDAPSPNIIENSNTILLEKGKSSMKAIPTDSTVNSVVEALKGKTVRFTQGVNYIFTKGVETGQLARENVLDTLDSIRNANFNPTKSVSQNVTQVKEAAEASVKAGPSKFPRPDEFKLVASSANNPVSASVSSISEPISAISEPRESLRSLLSSSSQQLTQANSSSSSISTITPSSIANKPSDTYIAALNTAESMKAMIDAGQSNVDTLRENLHILEEKMIDVLADSANPESPYYNGASSSTISQAVNTITSTHNSPIIEAGSVASSSSSGSVAQSIHNSPFSDPGSVAPSIQGSPITRELPFTDDLSRPATPITSSLPTPDPSPSKISNLNPNASSFIPSRTINYPNPDDYLVDQHNVIQRFSPISSQYGTVGFQRWEEIHDRTLIQVSEPSGAIKTIAKESFRKRFF